MCFVKKCNKRIPYEISTNPFMISIRQTINMNHLKSRLPLKYLNKKIYKHILIFPTKPIMNTNKELSTGMVLHTDTELDLEEPKNESIRMKKFHKKLKLQPMPRVSPRERFVDLVLVETDPKNGELIANAEKDPTKWGDWQNGGRVSDF